MNYGSNYVFSYQLYRALDLEEIRILLLALVQDLIPHPE
jgi:hypothetical protein